MFAEFKFDFKKMVLLIFEMCVYALLLFNMSINLSKMNLTNLDAFIVSFMCVSTLYFMLVIVRWFIDKYIFSNGKDK